eukprot:8824644-Pyramimonas_sp.AAC.1
MRAAYRTTATREGSVLEGPVVFNFTTGGERDRCHNRYRYEHEWQTLEDRIEYAWHTRGENGLVRKRYPPSYRIGLDTDPAELTVKTLSSHLITLERIQFSRRFPTDDICPCRAPL